MKYCRLSLFLTNQNINVIFAVVGLFNKARLWNKKNIKNYCEIYIKSKTKEIIKNKKKKMYFKYKKNLVGIDIKPEFPQKPDIEIYNDLKKPIDNLSKFILRKINFLYK